MRLQVGARVMYLKNDMMQHNLCNGTVSVVTDVDKQAETVRVAFVPQGQLIDTVLRPISAHFTVNGQHATRRQFPLQNSFALTVHKAQGITLPKISTFLDNQFFAPGQAYVALSRARYWNDVQIPCLSRNAFIVDQSLVQEYARLEQKERSYNFM